MEIVEVQTEEQLEAVRALNVEYYHFILEQYGVDMGYDYFRAEVEALPGPYAPPTGRLLLAREDGADGTEAMGCAGLRQISGKRCELKRLYVRANYRGRGVGRALVEALVDAAREMGYHRVQVHTAKFLTEALGLYRDLGFEVLPSPEGEDDPEMFMALEIGW